MRDGDRLLAVNGEITEDVDHQEVVLHIRADSSQVTLLVIDEEGSNFYDLVGNWLENWGAPRLGTGSSVEKVDPPSLP